ncbi:MAG: Hsp70 family protein [Nitrospirota bacterium]
MTAGSFQYNRMAVDFGTSNTVVAFWDEDKSDVVLHHIPDVTLPYRFIQDGREMEIPYIPSLIYYKDIKTNFIGYQVLKMMLERSKGSFRWIKAYIQSRRAMKYPLPDGSQVDYLQAGRDFLHKVVSFASESGYADISTCEVAFTVPIEAFEHYTDWLSDACIQLRIRRYRFIDESTACIFGYDTHLQAGDIFLTFDFGGGTLDVSVVRIEDRIDKGKGCRVMGKAGCRIGGRTIDGWLYDDLLRRAKIRDFDAREASALFMLNVEKIKEDLSNQKSVEYDFIHKHSGLRLKGVYHRSELEEMLDEKGIYHDVQETINRALKDAREHGVSKEDIKEALLVGGTSQMPSIRRLVTAHFGKNTRSFHPYDAVARGACRFLCNDIEALYDHIQHDYAIKSFDRKSGTNKFAPLIPKGTKYPTAEDFRKLTLKATHEGQRFFGIEIYEIAQKGSSSTGIGEIYYDLNGYAIFKNIDQSAGADTEFWMNEDKPMFIEASPPAGAGSKRFSVSFMVDSQKRLLVTVWDILNQRHIYRDYPVVKLK